MYKIIETYIVFTSKGETTLHIDEDGDLHIMSDNSFVIAEVWDKYYNR